MLVHTALSKIKAIGKALRMHGQVNLGHNDINYLAAAITDIAADALTILAQPYKVDGPKTA